MLSDPVSNPAVIEAKVNSVEVIYGTLILLATCVAAYGVLV